MKNDPLFLKEEKIRYKMVLNFLHLPIVKDSR